MMLASVVASAARIQVVRVARAIRRRRLARRRRSSRTERRAIGSRSSHDVRTIDRLS